MRQTHDRFINARLLEYISRPQYKLGCSIASLTAVFNYLYANQIGLKTSRELALALGKNVENIGTRGNVPENEDLMHWFDSLVNHYHVKGASSVYFCKTNTKDWEKTILELKEYLKRNDVAFIYNLENHYDLVVGYFEHAKEPEYAFEKETAHEKHIEINRWIVLGDHSPSFDPIWCRRWKTIIDDVQDNPPHCIMLFRKDE